MFRPRRYGNSSSSSSRAVPRRVQPKPVSRSARLFKAFKLGQQYYFNSEHQQAIAQFDSVIIEDPNYLRAYLFRGHAYKKVKEYEMALSDYFFTLQNAHRDPKFNKQEEAYRSITDIYLAMAIINIKQKNPGLALTELDRALEYAPHSYRQLGQVYARRGQANKMLGQLHDAISDYAEASNLDSQNTYYVRHLARLMQDVGDYYSAIHYYTNLIALGDDPEKTSKSIVYCYQKSITAARGEEEKRELQSYYEAFLESLVGQYDWVALAKRRLLASSRANPSESSASSSTAPRPKQANELHLDSGRYAFKRAVLCWGMDDIYEETYLGELPPFYNTADAAEQYYDAYIPMIFEECKAALRQGFEEAHQPFNRKISKVKYSRGINNPCTLTLPKLPKRVTEVTMSHLALWLKFKINGSKKTFDCLGLATVSEFGSEVKFICTTTDILEKIVEGITVSVQYLTALVSFERMFSVCYEKPMSPLVEMIAKARLPSWQQPLVPHVENLDESQSGALLGFLASPLDSVYLLQGPPGTGKTTTIVALLNECISRGLRVLVTAPSNKAIQVIASRALKRVPQAKMILAGVKEKVSDECMDIFIHGWHQRIYSQLTTLFKLATKYCRSNDEEGLTATLTRINTLFDRIAHYYTSSSHYIESFKLVLIDFYYELLANQDGNEPAPNARFLELLQYIEQLLASPIEDETKELYLFDNSEIIFASLSVTGRHVFSKVTASHFDMCIIDEAGQSVEAETLIPFTHFTFSKLLLVGDIMQLPATTISPAAEETHYNWSMMWRLQQVCEQPYSQISYQYRMDPAISQWPSAQFYDGGLYDGASVLERSSPLGTRYQTIFPYSFVDVSTGREKRNKTSYCNYQERYLSVLLARALVKKFPEISIGIITFYSAQVEIISEQLNTIDNVTINSVDGFQGDERDVIIVSFVRSNKKGAIGFVKDFRRLNVAITRARYGLIMLGNHQTLQAMPHDVAAIVEDASNRGCLINEKKLKKVCYQMNPPHQSGANSGKKRRKNNNKKRAIPNKAVASTGTSTTRPAKPKRVSSNQMRWDNSSKNA